MAGAVFGPGLDVRNALTGQTVRARRGRTTVRITGQPGELLLFLFGRQAVAEVEFDGPTTAIQVLKTARIGLWEHNLLPRAAWSRD